MRIFLSSSVTILNPKILGFLFPVKKKKKPNRGGGGGGGAEMSKIKLQKTGRESNRSPA